MNFSFRLEKCDKKTHARAGIIYTPHGEIRTPSFSPVATKAVVKSVDNDDLMKAKTQVILANAYHLFLKPGLSVIKEFGGFGCNIERQKKLLKACS